MGETDEYSPAISSASQGQRQVPAARAGQDQGKKRGGPHAAGPRSEIAQKFSTGPNHPLLKAPPSPRGTPPRFDTNVDTNPGGQQQSTTNELCGNPRSRPGPRTAANDGNQAKANSKTARQMESVSSASSDALRSFVTIL